jgi:hypothetical protein
MTHTEAARQHVTQAKVAANGCQRSPSIVAQVEATLAIAEALLAIEATLSVIAAQGGER